MNNSFFIVTCRFHSKDKNQLLVKGYFSNNEMEGSHPIIELDTEELYYEAKVFPFAPANYRMIGENEITKGYFLWTKLPEGWESYKELKILNSEGGNKEFLWSISVERLKEWEKTIFKNIDIVVEETNGFRVDGWYIDGGKSSVSFLDMKGMELPVDMMTTKRPDVLGEFPENKTEEVVGFSAHYEGEKPDKIIVRFENKDAVSEEIVTVKLPYMKKTVKEWKTMYRKVKDCYRQYGIKGVLLRTGDRLSGQESLDYDEWARRREPSKGTLRKQKMRKFKYMPKVSIVVPLYKTPENYLREMIESVRNQTYRNWELCLSDGSGENSPIKTILQEYEKKDVRIRVVHNEKQLHISDNTNEALKISKGDFIAFLDHDDLLTPDALYECIRVINQSPDTEFIYSDEDKVNMDSTEYFLPHFKTDFNIDMLRSTNYFCHFVMVKKDLYQRVGMLNSKYDGAQDYDFVLRCVEKTTKIVHIPKVLYHWRACEGSTAASGDNKAYGVIAGEKAIRAHYERMGIDADVIPLEFPGMYRTKYRLKENPLVSVIIPNKDHIEDLDKCLRSIEEKSGYSNLEIIVVENNSTEKRTFEYYKELEERNPKVKVLYWTGKGFNYPAINTFGVNHSKGEYLLFLNNDTEIINGDCIEELLGYCMREDVGAVGARLYYADGTLQHAGVIIGYGGVAGHAFVGSSPDYPGYFARIRVAHDLSAVTAACVMVKRNVYEEVGGFDEEYAVAFNDIDLCLKIRKAGYLIVYNPYAELMHYESKSRGPEDTEEKIKRFQKEIMLFRSRWMQILEKGDPYYNPNLTLDRNDFSLNMAMGKRK